MTIFQGCHSNGKGYHHEIFQDGRTKVGVHFMSISRSAISNEFDAMSENVIFPWFWATNRPFSPGYHSNEMANQLFAADIFTEGRVLLDKCTFGALYTSQASQDFENHDFWRKLRDKKSSEANISKTVGDRSLSTAPVMNAHELLFSLVQLSSPYD